MTGAGISMEFGARHCPASGDYHNIFDTIRRIYVLCSFIIDSVLEFLISLVPIALRVQPV